MMKPADATAVASFLEQGGEVLKVREALPAAEPEILGYLESCGVKVKYFPGGTPPYGCHGKRYSMATLVRLANVYRRSQELPPFALTLRYGLAARSRPHNDSR